MKSLIGIFFRLLIRIRNKVLADPQLAQLYRQLANKEQFNKLWLHERMLADTARVNAYANAIAKYVTEADVVFDLGTGTGILALLAAQRNPGKVYAVDHADIIETARSVATHNQLTNITFIKAQSQNVTLPEKVDVLVQEQIGSWLFNENMIDSVLDIRERLLKPGGKILPGRFELFIEPVQLKAEYRVPLIWEQSFSSIAFDNLKALKSEVGAEYFQQTVKPHEVDYSLCAPVALLEFDLTTLRKEDLPTTLHLRRPVARAGRLDGFCLYFNVIFDEEISFTTLPLHNEQPHTSWNVPFYRVEAEALSVGTIIEFALKMEEISEPKSWQWDYQGSSAPASVSAEAHQTESVHS